MNRCGELELIFGREDHARWLRAVDNSVKVETAYGIEDPLNGAICAALDTMFGTVSIEIWRGADGE